MKRYGERQIRRTLSKYDTLQVRRSLAAGYDLQMTEVGDVNVLLDSMIEREGRFQGVDRFPYWAELWPTALAMAQWFCRAEEPIPKGWTCELGCGLGLVGIALARLGWRVEATDFVEDALIFAAHNARLNRVQHNHRVAYLDWRNPVGGRTSAWWGRTSSTKRRTTAISSASCASCCCPAVDFTSEIRSARMPATSSPGSSPKAIVSGGKRESRRGIQSSTKSPSTSSPSLKPRAGRFGSRPSTARSRLDGLDQSALLIGDIDRPIVYLAVPSWAAWVGRELCAA